MKLDDRKLLALGTIVSTDQGIQIGVVPDDNSGVDYVERINPKTGEILWCETGHYNANSDELLAFLKGEGIYGNPFTEPT